MGMFVSTER